MIRLSDIRDNSIFQPGCIGRYATWFTFESVSILDCIACGWNPDRAPLKEVLGGQYNYREGGGKCCGKALKAAGGVEVVDVIRIRAPKK